MSLPVASVLVIQPDPADPLDRFEAWLTEHGLTLRVVRPYAGDDIPSVLAEDALVVLGGKMSSNDDEQHPWLEDIRRLMRATVQKDRPLLGICLGGQMMAQAFGGRVVLGEAGIEAGLVEVKVRDEASDDPLFGGAGPSVLTSSMHVDMIDALPPDAVWLAASDTYAHQAFRLGERAWGLQFHPEISPDTFGRWVGMFHSDDPDDMKRVAEGGPALAAADEAVTQSARVLAGRFAGVVKEMAGEVRPDDPDPDPDPDPERVPVPD